MKQVIRKFARSEEGAVAIEYGIFAALIAVVIIVAVTTLGDTLTGIFTDVNTQLTN